MMLFKIFGTILLSWLFVANNYDFANAGEFGPFQGRIVDSETKEPIEGVVVLFCWYQKHFFAGSTFIDVQETLTDKNGEFYVPGIWVLNPWKRLHIYPSVIIYKSGYGSTSGSGGHIDGPWYPLLKREWGAIKGTFIWKFENGNPLIMLKKLTLMERSKYLTPGEPFVQGNKYHQVKWKWKLLRLDINKERRSRGLDELIDSDGFGR